jgi:hypothetical protein
MNSRMPRANPDRSDTVSKNPKQKRVSRARFATTPIAITVGIVALLGGHPIASSAGGVERGVEDSDHGVERGAEDSDHGVERGAEDSDHGVEWGVERSDHGVDGEAPVTIPTKVAAPAAVKTVAKAAVFAPKRAKAAPTVQRAPKRRVRAKAS